MLKLIRFIGLVSQSIMIQFAHLFGVVAFAAAVALGYFRLPSWSVPILAVVCGVVSDKFIDEASVTGLLEKAHSANQRGGFLIVVYFVICAVGYVVGAYGRHYQRKRVTKAAAKE
jgi:cbb3-type cytochrome oxidase subunit 3